MGMIRKTVELIGLAVLIFIAYFIGATMFFGSAWPR
jgi:hypothetical protein